VQRAAIFGCALIGLCMLPGAAAASGWAPGVQVSSGTGQPVGAAIASGGDATVAHDGSVPSTITRDLLSGTWAPEQVVPFSPSQNGWALAVADGGAGTQFAFGSQGDGAAVRSGIGEPWAAIDAPFASAPSRPAPAASPTGDLAVAASVQPAGQPPGVYVVLRPSGARAWSAPLIVDPVSDGSVIADVVAAMDGDGALDVGWEVQAPGRPKVTTVKVAQVSIIDGVATAPQTLVSVATRPGKRPSYLAISSANGRSLIAWSAVKHVDAAERQAGSATFAYLGVVSGADNVLQQPGYNRPVASVGDDGGALLAWFTAKTRVLRAVQGTIQSSSFPAATSVTANGFPTPYGPFGAKLPGSGAMLVWAGAGGSVNASRATSAATWGASVAISASSDAYGPRALAAAPTGEAITLWDQSDETWASTFTP
jgi:hypothetical protein